MRSLKSGLFGFAAAGTLVCAAVVGCSAEGTTDPGVEPTPETEPTTPLPPSNPEEQKPEKKDAGKDAKTDAKADTGVDAGPPPPEPGTDCTGKDQQVVKKLCGKCGKAETVCINNKWTEYGPCTGEIGLCAAGATQECGKCGVQTCSNSCNWGVCGGEPANACVKSTTEYSQAGCGVGQYRKRDCSTTCQWGSFSVTCAEPVNANVLTIGTTANAQVTGSYSLIATRFAKRQPTYTCGTSATLSTTTDHPYELIELRNPDTTKTATMNVTMSGTVSFYAGIAVYPTNLPPNQDTELKACTIADYGYYSPTSPTSSYWPDLYSFTIPPLGRALVRVQAYYATSTAAANQPTTGAFGLVVKTTSIN